MDGKKTKKILLCYLGRRGGGVINAFETANALRTTCAELTCLISENIENLSKWKESGINLVVIPTYNSKISYVVNSFLFRFKQKKIIKRAVGNVTFDLAYVPMTAYFDAKALNCVKYQQLVTVIHDPKPHGGTGFWNRRTGSAVKMANKLVVHSNVFVDYVSKKYDKPVISVPLGRHNYYKKSEVPKVGTFDEFLFFGRIEKYKGVGVLLDAFGAFRKKEPEAKLTVAGAGDISEFSKVLKTADNVTLLNKWFSDEELDKLLSSKRFIAVLPYTDATQSGVIYLAKEYELPIIATKTGGITEQINDGVTGLLCLPRDPRDLEDKMAVLYNNSELCQKLSSAAIEEVQSLTWDNVATKILELIKDGV